MQTTSREAYALIAPQLGERQQKVLNILLKNGPMTNTEMSVYSGIPINAVTPRTNELVKLGLVHELSRRPCRVTGRRAIVWSAYKETLF